MSRITDKDHPMLEGAFEKILSICCPGESPGLAEVEEWMRKMIRETVKGGKLTRGLLLLLTYQDLEKSMTEEKLMKAAILAWVIEMFHTVGLILDDIMDSSSKRRGKLCWHKKDGIGMMAVNDAVLLEQCLYKVLHETFGENEYSDRISKCMRHTGFSTTQGQCLDLLCERGKIYDPQVYDELVRIKTSLYTVMFPMRLALILANVNDAKLEQKIENVSIKIGRFFQIQDDFLDCFGDSTVSGKIGSDIINGKCTWLWVTAMQTADDNQKEILKDNYGRGVKDGPEETAVITIYRDLDLKGRYEKDTNRMELELITLLEDCDFPFTSFHILLKKIAQRKS